MTVDDKRLIADYMGLIFNPARMSLYEYYNGREFHFNLNDARMCVEKMEENRDWWHFWLSAEDLMRKDETLSYNHCNESDSSLLCRWLFYNFFAVMAKWLREREVK